MFDSEYETILAMAAPEMVTTWVQTIDGEGGRRVVALTKDTYEGPYYTRAEVLEVPIVVVRDDTFSVAKKMEAILSRHKLRDIIKIQHGSQLVSSIIDFPHIKDALGL